MGFYIFRQDKLIEGSAAIDGVPDSIDVEEWISGKAMPDPGELNLELSLESGDYRGDIMDTFLTLYHKALKEIFDKLGVDNIQYFPVTVHDQNTNKMERGYYLVNIIGLLDCVDTDRSRIRLWRTGQGFDFESMVIDESKTYGLKIFRLKDDPTKVIINEELKQYFDDNDILVGVEIIPTEEYSDW